jgi:predicted DNA-binding transcriptional regulator AlpA
MVDQQMSDLSNSATPKRLIPHRRYAEAHGVSTKTIDRWVADGILPEPTRINARKYFQEGTEPRHDGESAA